MMNWKSSALPPWKGLAVDLAFEVDRHAVALGGAIGGRALGEGAALLAQDVDRAVDGGLGDLGGSRARPRPWQVADLDFGVDLEGGVERQLAFGRASFW
jgi:hypothetical protein